MTGKQAQVRQAQQRRDVDRSNLGAVGGVDKAMGMVGSIGLNATAGGVSQAVNTIGGAMGAGEKLLNEKVLDYDQNGNASIRGHNVDERRRYCWWRNIKRWLISTRRSRNWS